MFIFSAEYVCPKRNTQVRHNFASRIFIVCVILFVCTLCDVGECIVNRKWKKVSLYLVPFFYIKTRLDATSTKKKTDDILGKWCSIPRSGDCSSPWTPFTLSSIPQSTLWASCFAVGNSTVRVMHVCKVVWIVTSLFPAACEIRIRNLK
jgi:hypothetical protein